MDSFEILAEVAIGLAGFGSIAVVLGRSAAGWDPGDFFRTAVLFGSSLGALFLALLPIGLATSELAPEWIWRTSSGVQLAYIVVFTTLVIRMRRRHLAPELYFGPLLSLLVASTTLANLLAQAANAFAIRIEPQAAVHFFGVVWYLLYGCLILMRIVFVRPQTG